MDLHAWTNTLLIFAGTLFAAWMARRSSKDTALGKFLEDVLARVKILEERLAVADQNAERLRMEIIEERQKKHDAMNTAHAAQMKLEHDVGVMKEQHAREMGELIALHEHEVGELRSRIATLEAENRKIADCQEEIARLRSEVEAGRAPPAT